MANLNISGLKSEISKLKDINKKGVKYGIFGRKANARASDGGRITMGHLARIMEEGRRYRHPGGVIKIENNAGEVRYWNVKPGTIIYIPRRPFFTFAYSIIRKDIPAMFKEKFVYLLNNKDSVDGFLKEVGELCKQIVVRTIESGSYTHLSKMQIFKKGHSLPLVDTGKLKKAVDYEIIKR